MNIIGFYKNLVLVEKDGNYLVVDRLAKNILYMGTEELASKYFIILSSEFINEQWR